MDDAEEAKAEIQRARDRLEACRDEKGELDPESELLLHEADAYDPVIPQAAGVIAVRHYLSLDEANMLLRYRYPDPTELHDYCAEILAELGKP